MVKALLKSSSFKEVSEQAIAAAKAINASSSKFSPKLKTMCADMYGNKSPTTILTVGETRWNSTQGCFASQLRIKAACKTFAVKHENELPAALKHWATNKFWHELEEAELLVRPFCDASYLTQRDANTMAHVVLVLLNLMQHLVTFCGDNGDTLELLADIEKRWNQEDNALFFLGFALHPEYNKTAVWILTQSLAKDGNWGDKENYLSVERLVQAAKFYYGKYELHDSEATDVTKEQALNRLGKSLKKWLVKPSDLRLDMFEHGENEVEYWNMQKLEHYEIANLAAFLLDAVIQAATCERIFKGYAQFHTKARNKLHPETTHQLTQVKRHVQHGNPDDVSMAKMSKNRIIPVTQHVRLDNDFASQSVVAMDSDTDDQGGGNKDVEWEEEEKTDLPNLWTHLA